MTVREAQTEILVWLWELGHPIFDREAQETALERDGPWQLTLTGHEFLDRKRDERIQRRRLRKAAAKLAQRVA